MRYEQLVRRNFNVSAAAGQEFLCHCPWHDDTSQGHLYVNVATGLYVCHSCGSKGHLDTLGAAMPVIGTEDVRERLRAMRKGPSETVYYPESWLDQFDNPHPYWTVERNLPEAVVRRFRLGYDPFSNRMTIPLKDSRGRVLGVTYRRLDDGKPKYLHPKGFPIGRHLYGAWQITQERKVAIVEGQVDALRCWSSRVPSVALMGARLTKDQKKVLQRLNIESVVLMMDNDHAGVQGTLSVYEMLRGSGIRVQVGWYRPYWHHVKDPDGLSPQRLRKAFHSALSITDYAELQGYEVA